MEMYIIEKLESYPEMPFYIWLWKNVSRLCLVRIPRIIWYKILKTMIESNNIVVLINVLKQSAKDLVLKIQPTSDIFSTVYFQVSKDHLVSSYGHLIPYKIINGKLFIGWERKPYESFVNVCLLDAFNFDLNMRKHTVGNTEGVKINGCKMAHGYGYKFAEKNVYIGEFRFNRMCGFGMLIYREGDKYVGEFVDDKEHGYGAYYRKNGSKFIGNWKNGYIDGFGTYYDSFGKMGYSGNYINNEMTGYGTMYDQTGNTRGYFQNGKLINGCKYFHENLETDYFGQPLKTTLKTTRFKTFEITWTTSIISTRSLLNDKKIGRIRLEFPTKITYHVKRHNYGNSKQYILFSQHFTKIKNQSIIL